MNPTNDGRHTVVGVFDSPGHAEKALNGLKDAGFTPEQVSVVARDNKDARELVDKADMDGAETSAVGAGALLGGLTGGALGWLVGLGALAIPGIGPIVAAGALATTLGGAAVGAVAGGLIGALAAAGVPEDDARAYEDHVKQGSILLTVDARDGAQETQARGIFDAQGGGSVRSYAAANAARAT